MMTERWVVGAEHDKRLLRRLSAALKQMGFELDTKSVEV
jgi:hypothetical protein